MEIKTKLIPNQSQRRSGIKNNGIKFIVAHDTGNDGSTAIGNVNYYIETKNDMQASAHYFVDDKEIILCIPEDEKAWHVRYGPDVDNRFFGADANDAAIAVELCYTTKGNFDSVKAYQNYCWLMADLCKRYTLDPMKHIVPHMLLDYERRTDPLNAFSKIGKTWPQFLSDVVLLMDPEEMVSISVPKSKVEKVLNYIKTI